jgi:integrase
MEFANRKNKKRIADLVKECENKIVYIYGPYPPAEGRTKWRVVIYDPSTGRRKSVCEETRGAADLLAEQLRRETETKPVLTVYEALTQWIDEKRSAWRNPDRVARGVENRIKVWIPDVPVDEIDAARASALYLAATKSEGKFGPLKAATHHGYLKVVKEFWRWLLDRELVEKDAFAKVKPIGKANAGKQQLGPLEAKTLERLLFERARQGEEGALAILVQLYLGLRPSEVLGLTVGAVDGRVCPHSLRGLHSSLALEAGATSNDVARSLGHSSFAVTAKHYAKADSIEVGKARRVAGSLHGKR